MLLARDCMYESSFFEIGALPSAIAAIISSPVSREEGAPRAAARPAAECNRAPPDPVRCHANRARGGGALGDCRCFWSLEPELIAAKGEKKQGCAGRAAATEPSRNRNAESPSIATDILKLNRATARNAAHSRPIRSGDD